MDIMNLNKNQAIGGFLMVEGGLSMVLSTNKSTIFQIGRLIRIGIGYYIYTGNL